MKQRPECPLCVTRTCANCSFKDVALNREYMDKHLPGGECRRCGAARGAVTEKPVRHTNQTIHAMHVEYANRPPVERIVRDPIAVAEALDLATTLDDVYWKANHGARNLPTDDDRHMYLIDWAAREMPVLTLIRQRFIKEQPLNGLKLAAEPCNLTFHTCFCFKYLLGQF